jgi:hypothetical protein
MKCREILVTVVLMSGCRWLGYRPLYECRSPDGLAEVRVLRDWSRNATTTKFRIEVTRGGETDMVFSREREAYLGLIETSWFPDAKQVGLLVCDMFSGPVLINYDIMRHRVLPTAVIQRSIEAQIQHRYSLAPGTDVLTWACSERGSAAYRR